MEASPVGETEVDVGRGVVEPTPTSRGETLGQAAHGLVVREGDAGPLQPRATVDPHLLRTVDQDVGDAGQAEQGFERTGTHDVAVQGVVHGQHGGVAHRAALVAQRLGDELGVSGAASRASRSRTLSSSSTGTSLMQRLPAARPGARTHTSGPRAPGCRDAIVRAPHRG